MAGAPPPVHRCAERLCMRQLELLVTTALRELIGEKTMEAVLAHENICWMNSGLPDLRGMT